MPAAPTEVDAQRRDGRLHEARGNERGGRDGHIRRLQHGCLRLASEHGIGQRHAAQPQNYACEQGFRHRTGAHFARKHLRCAAGRVEHPARRGARKRQRHQPRQLGRADVGGREARQASPAAEHLAKPHERGKRAGHRAQVHHRFLRLRQHDVHLVARAGARGRAPVGRAGKRRGKPVQRRGEHGRQRRLRAHHGHGAEVAAESAHAVAHPRAQARDDAGKPRLGAHAAAEQQRKQGCNRAFPQVVIRVTAFALHAGHNAVQLFGRKAHVLFVQPDDQAAAHAHDKRPRQHAETTRLHAGQRAAHRRAKRLGQRVPRELDTDVHAEEKRPHERAGQRARDKHARQKQHAVERFRKQSHVPSRS